MKDLTQGNEGKLIIRFALPMLLGNLFQQLYVFVDSIIVGQVLGKEALAAIGASFPLIYVLISMVIGIGSGASVVLSQYFGAKKIPEVKRTISTLFIFFIAASFLVTGIGLLFNNAIFTLLQLPDDVKPAALSYFNIYVAGQVFFFGFNGITSVLRGMGDSKTPLYFMIISTFLNIVLDILMVMVLDMGIEGAAYATIIAQAGAFFIASFYLHKTHEIISFKMKELIFDLKLFKQSMRIGLPTGFQQSFVALGIMALLGIVNGFGTDVLAAYTASTRIDAIASMPAMNLGSALAAFVGQNIGAGKIERVRNGLISTLKIGAIISVSVSIIVLLFDDAMMRAFTTDEAVIEIGKRYLHIVCTTYILFSTMFAFHGLFRGAGDTLVPMFVSLFSLWLIRVPVAYFLSDRIGSDGIWWAIPLAWFIGMTVSYIYYKTGRWKLKSVIE